MNAGAHYGLFLGLLSVTLLRLAPQPLGGVVLYLGLALQLAAGAPVVWRRMRLARATAALVLGATALAVLGYRHAVGLDLGSLPAGWMVPLGALIAAGPVLLAWEVRASPGAMAAWEAAMSDCSVLDMLRWRHIPQIRPER